MSDDYLQFLTGSSFASQIFLNTVIPQCKHQQNDKNSPGSFMTELSLLNTSDPFAKQWLKPWYAFKSHVCSTLPEEITLALLLKNYYGDVNTFTATVMQRRQHLGKSSPRKFLPLMITYFFRYVKICTSNMSLSCSSALIFPPQTPS